MLFGIEWSARVSIDAEYLYHGSDPTREPRLARNSTVLPLGTVPPQQTHLLNEPINYLRGHKNAMPEA